MSYRASIDVAADPASAARAIREDIHLWWCERVDRAVNGFTVHFGDSAKTFVFDPGGTDRDFSWSCIEANLLHDAVSDPAEWVGTKLIWDLAPTDTGCRLTLTHEGLTPALQCHEVCVAGWQHFFESSLFRYLNGDPATPFKG